MDRKKIKELLLAKGDQRMTTNEALVVAYKNEEEGILDVRLSGDLVTLKQMLISLGKTNGFFRKIIYDTADALRVALKKKYPWRSENHSYWAGYPKPRSIRPSTPSQTSWPPRSTARTPKKESVE